MARNLDGEEATGYEESIEFLHIFTRCAMAAEGIERTDDVERAGREVLISKEAIVDGGIESFSGVVGGNGGGFDAFDCPFRVIAELAEEKAGSRTNVKQSSALGEEAANAGGVSGEALAARVHKGRFCNFRVRNVDLAEIGRSFLRGWAFGNESECAVFAGDNGEFVADSDEAAFSGAADWAIDASGVGGTGDGLRW